MTTVRAGARFARFARSRTASALVIAFVSALPLTAAADTIYSYVDADGVVHFSTKPTANAKARRNFQADRTRKAGQRPSRRITRSASSNRNGIVDRLSTSK